MPYFKLFQGYCQTFPHERMPDRISISVKPGCTLTGGVGMLKGTERQINFIQDCQLVMPGRAGDGAIATSPDRNWVNPYFANYTAMALLKAGLIQPVEKYLEWYLRHLEPDGSIYDWLYDPEGTETIRPADSEDAYAGTFLSLVAQYCLVTRDYQWPIDHNDLIDKILGLMLKLTASDGLTKAKKNYPVKYLADNCECFRGLSDYATLVMAANPEKGREVQKYAHRLSLAIEKRLWNSRNQWYYVAKHPLGFRVKPRFSRWYPDAVSLIYPAFCQVIPPSSQRAKHLYHMFNYYQPGWVSLATGDSYPWILSAYWAGLMGDSEKAVRMLENADQNYVETKSPYWYNAEAGFYVMTSLLTGRG